ncbi:MAG: hypothetical protein HY540_04715 [Deltaproteobacteria bacterium]|nr:hypothetical protein [Deltaproteobacteria bacterium]
MGKASRDDRKLVTHDSPQVQQILRVAGLPQNVLKNMNVMAVQYVPGKPIILVHEDDSHGDAEIELIKRDVSHQFMQSPLSAHPVFIELPGAPEMIPSKENDWKAIQTILRDDELMSLSVDDPNFGDKVVRIAGGIGATQLMHRLPALQALKKALGHTPISYAEMKKRYGKEKVIRELLDQMDATFAFEFLYGDRAVLLNVESAHPLIVKKKSEHERINTPVPDEARAANTRFNHAIVDLGVQPSAQDYAVINQSADKRTKRWAERLVGFPKDNPELFPKGKPAVIFFSGGSAHMPLLTEELKKAGDSYLFLRKKPSDV